MSELKDTAKSRGRAITAYGVILIILGILALLAPGLVGVSITLLLGIMVVAGGIIRTIFAFQAGSFGRGVLMFVVGGLTVLAGVALLADPLLAAGVLTIVLGAYFILDGTAEIAAGVWLRPRAGWGWMVFGGIVSVLLGVMIWTQFPLSGPWAIGILMGIKLFMVGLMMVTAGSTIRSLGRAQGRAD